MVLLLQSYRQLQSGLRIICRIIHSRYLSRYLNRYRF